MLISRGGKGAVWMLALASLWSCRGPGPGPEGPAQPPVPKPVPAVPAAGGSAGPTLSGPYTHRNLAVFLVHGTDRLRHRWSTLEEALAQKRIVVHETGDVNELSVENVSDGDVYIQAGDIVKGGQQDRLIAVDLVVPARSGRVPVASFCVEQGRWSRRGGENVAAFSSSPYQIASRELKLAARKEADQTQVWAKVARLQEGLSQNLKTPVASASSASSLQLTLENGTVQQAADAYTSALSSITKGRSDVVGVAFAVDGRINSVEVYGSADLFAKLWPKTLRAAAVEAVAGHHRDASTPPSLESVRAWIAQAEAARATEKPVGGRMKLVTRESDANILFETLSQDEWVHRSYVAK